MQGEVSINRLLCFGVECAAALPSFCLIFPAAGPAFGHMFGGVVLPPGLAFAAAANSWARYQLRLVGGKAVRIHRLADAPEWARTHAAIVQKMRKLLNENRTTSLETNESGWYTACALTRISGTMSVRWTEISNLFVPFAADKRSKPPSDSKLPGIPLTKSAPDTGSDDF